MSKVRNTEEQVQQEVLFGTWPVLKKERKYGFIDALLVLSGYCIATWSYTQGSYLATLVGFKQLLIGAFLAALFMLLVYQLPVILSVRYGIDIWIWLRSVFGPKGVNILTIAIIVVNFPWYAVCCELFAGSMENLLGIFGITPFPGLHLILSLSCVILGTLIAYRGISSITWTTRILVPLLLLVGVVVVIVGFTSVPMDVIWNYTPELTEGTSRSFNYILSIEANFAFVITLVGGMAEVPRLCKSERSGYYAGVFGQGIAGSFFVVVGAVMAIAMQHVTGTMSDDPTLMMATLAVPALGLCSLLLVAFANIGTQAVGSYIYGVMLKSTFPKTSYRILILVLGAYVSILCVWGKIIEYFGSFLTIGALVYAPLAALLFVDFFMVRKQKIDLKSAFGLEGHDNYQYTKGFNIVGAVCFVLGFAFSLLIYDPIKSVVHVKWLFVLTPTGASFLFTALLYLGLSRIPYIRRYIRRDCSVVPDTRPFDRYKVPPKQNLFLTPLIWLVCKIIVAPYKLKIEKHNMKGVKPPFLVLGTHQSFYDFYVSPLCLIPFRANYISELEGFEAYGEWIYRQVGCLGTRKFINDRALLINIKKVIDRGGIMVIYPEARYANVGTQSELQMSVAKLAKHLNVPVVTLNMKGNYLLSPIWNLKLRKSVRLHADVDLALTAEQTQEMSLQQIHDILYDKLSYNEYEYQKKAGIKIDDSFRAEGLHKALYRCIWCGTDFSTVTDGSRIRCKKCGAEFELSPDGDLIRKDREGKITIPEWYDSIREDVDKEVDEGRYSLDIKVKVVALPNSVNFIDCGEGRLKHGSDGFDLTFNDYRQKKEITLHFAPKSTISVHTEYNYRDKFGECITLSTLDDTYFLYPLEEGFSATKIQFAAEHLAKINN
ncbi:MAG: cytosine permease [Clostridiales bacterium]|nr:cytosine permease [Clostridiales bacterium]